MEEVKKQIEQIKSRNKRVEADKAWEGSWMRKISIILCTYVVIAAILYSLGVEKPYLQAIIPATGYLLSTLSINRLKAWWIENVYKK